MNGDHYTRTNNGFIGQVLLWSYKWNLRKRKLQEFNAPKEAAKKFLSYQKAKCSASGFVTGFGGVIYGSMLNAGALFLCLYHPSVV